MAERVKQENIVYMSVATMVWVTASKRQTIYNVLTKMYAVQLICKHGKDTYLLNPYCVWQKKQHPRLLEARAEWDDLLSGNA